MRSRRALGLIAIIAIIVAAISFAVVDISTSAASGCLDTASPCSDQTSPVVATVFAIVGALALIGAVVPAIAWLVGTRSAPQGPRGTDVDYSREPRIRTGDPEDQSLTGG